MLPGGALSHRGNPPRRVGAGPARGPAVFAPTTGPGTHLTAAQGFPPSLSQQSMKVQEAARPAWESCVRANLHLLFLLESKISLSEADLVAQLMP